MSKKSSNIKEPELSIADRIGRKEQQKTELIGEIYEKSKHCGLNDDFFEKIDADLEVLSTYLKTTKMQAFFVANIIPMSFQERAVGVRELITYFNCNAMKLMKYTLELEGLNKLGIIKKVRMTKSRRSSISNEFIINENILEAISLGKEIELNKYNASDIYQILQSIFDLWQKVDDEEISSSDARQELEEILNFYQSEPLIQRIISYDFNIQDSFLFVILIWRTLIGIETISLERITEGLFDHNSFRIKYIRTFLAEENPLLIKNLVEKTENNFSSEVELKLTEDALAILEECGLKIYSPNKKRSEVINPEDIVYKELIYNNEELKQLSLLKDLLDESNLNSTQCRLIEKGLPQGINVLLHGAPGTGKSEFVYQIAKYTDRQIYRVDISNSKSAFFGESEKKIKKIFTEYKKFAKECTKTPILLFNEADAIFSKRKDIGSSSVAQTENSIQNIILEEMENLEDSILIATTNVSNHFDCAFSRRFLFKIHLKKPDTAVKVKIWALKLPRLSASECESLARQFDFSGGQIDNIVRKAEISEVLGQSVGFDQIICFCKEEILNNNHRNKIGFI